MAVPAIAAAIETFLKSPAGRKIIASVVTSALSNSASKQSGSDNKNDEVENMSQGQKLDKIREVMVGSPTDYIVRGAAAAGAGVSDIIGNKAVSDANHLAQAILAANRTNSVKQNEIYGPSRKENASNVWAQEKLRRGEKVKNTTNEISNVIRNLSGLYGQRDDAVRAMQAQEILGAPGNFYNYLNSVQRANAALTTDKKGGK